MQDNIKLSARNITIKYTNPLDKQPFISVDNISLDIKEGEFVSIVGLSGCGKSSFLNSIAGLVRPESGEVLIDGERVDGPGAGKAVVFQNASLLPWRNVQRNISYVLELKGVPKKEAQRRTEKYIDIVQLKGFEKYLPHQLSGGMQQRVNLARALVTEPKVMLLDEPFAALDAITRQNMQDELLDIWQKTKKTVLMVTHQIDEAVLLSDRVVIFSQRPAHVVEIVNINFPRPRTARMKNDAEFTHISQLIWKHIYSGSEKEAEIEYEI